MSFLDEHETIIGFAVEELISQLDEKQGASLKWPPNRTYSKAGDYGLLVEGEFYQKEVKADNYIDSWRFPLEFAHKVNGIWIPSGHTTSSAAVLEAYRFSTDTCYSIHRHKALNFILTGQIHSGLIKYCNIESHVPTKCYMLDYSRFKDLGLFSSVREDVIYNFSEEELYFIFKYTKGITLNLPLEKREYIKRIIS